MDTPIFSPFDLQCCNTLAGIANSERTSVTVKLKAEEILLTLLAILQKDVSKISLESSGIQLHA
jgi:hypothetical protein